MSLHKILVDSSLSDLSVTLSLSFMSDGNSSGAPAYLGSAAAYLGSAAAYLWNNENKANSVQFSLSWN